MLNLTPYDLSVDRLDVHAVSPVFTVLLTIKMECCCSQKYPYLVYTTQVNSAFRAL